MDKKETSMIGKYSSPCPRIATSTVEVIVYKSDLEEKKNEFNNIYEFNKWYIEKLSINQKILTDANEQIKEAIEHTIEFNYNLYKDNPNAIYKSSHLSFHLDIYGYFMWEDEKKFPSKLLRKLEETLLTNIPSEYNLDISFVPNTECYKLQIMALVDILLPKDSLEYPM
jgi:hypothetical protein